MVLHSRYLYLLRHGQYHIDRDSEDSSGHLTGLGRKQAAFAAKAIREEIPEVNGIYCSTMARASETAEIVAEEYPGMKYSQSRSLCECFPYLTERMLSMPEIGQGTPVDEIKNRLCRDREYREALHSRCEGKFGARPDPKPADKAYDRFFIRARTREKHDILVCHGNIIRYFVTKAVRVLPEVWGNMAIHNCGITVLKVNKSGKVILYTFNDYAYMPKEFRTMT